MHRQLHYWLKDHIQGGQPWSLMLYATHSAISRYCCAVWTSRLRYPTILQCSLVNSRLDYCNSPLHNVPEMTTNKLHRAQNNAVHVLQTAKHCTNAKLFCSRLHWLSVRQHIIHKTTVLFWKAHTTGIPTSLKQLSENLQYASEVYDILALYKSDYYYYYYYHYWLYGNQQLILLDAHYICHLE